MSDTERAEAIAAFDLEAPKLPDIIAKTEYQKSGSAF
jgi:hypothetical protein